MTRNEAINFLKIYRNEELYTEECINAHEMAIEALQKEPCNDCIRRSDIGLTDFEIVMCNGDYKEGLKMLLDKIEKAPSVTPQPRWIPTSEKLPEKGMPVIWLMEYGDIDSDYYGMLYDRGRKYPDFYIAWMPFPEIPKLT